MGKAIASNEYTSFNSNKIDVMKLVLAILVVGIHTSVAGMVFRPILRIAVPSFFIITSYLFFLKQKQLTTHDERKHGLVKYVKRILCLYLFWFVVLLPVTIKFRHWTDDFSVVGLLEIFRNFLFSSTFIASWFLMASVVGVVIVWFMTERRVRDVWILVVGIAAYVLCCLLSNYRFIIEHIPNFNEIYGAYEMIFTAPYNSFPCALLFVAIGKILAHSRIHIPNKILVIVLVVSLVALYFEFYITRSLSRVIWDDCYFSLPLICVAVFMLVGQSKSAKMTVNVKKMRAYSTIIYCCHASIAHELGETFVKMEFVKNSPIYYLMLFAFTLCAALIVSYTVLWFEKYKPLRVLRYAH